MSDMTLCRATHILIYAIYVSVYRCTICVDLHGLQNAPRHFSMVRLWVKVNVKVRFRVGVGVRVR